jgi:SEC-C motif
MTSETTAPGWATDVLAILAAGRPVPVDRLAERTGARRGELLMFLQRCAHLLETSVGWVDGLRLADGVAFAHELSAAECEADALAADDDLALWAVLASDGLPLVGGGTVRARPFPELPATMRSGLPAGCGMIGQGLVGPAGWLAGFQAGDLLRVGLRDGGLAVEATTRPPYRSGHVAALLAACMAALGRGMERYREGEGETPAADLSAVLAELLVTRPEVLAEPLPPLGSLLRPACWETFGGRVGFAGTAWNTTPLRRLDRATAMTAMLALGALLTWDGTGSDGDATMGTLRQGLAIPEVLGYLADEVERRVATAGTSFAPVLDRLTAAAATPTERAAAALLAARAAEGAGDSVSAHRLVTRALTDQGDLQPAVLDAVEYAACRGELRVADELLRHLDHPVAETLRSAVRSVLDAPAAAGQPGRNQPCPCGSGRKYKVCCQATAVAPLPARAGLLYTLVATFAQRPATGDRFGLLINQLGGDPQGVLLCVDLLLTHEGAAERFLRVRGAWLRDDERHLIDSWAAIPIGAFEIREVRRGVGVTVRMLPGGEQVVLRDRKFSTCVRPLDLYCGRILTNGACPQLLAMPVLVARERRHDLLDLLASGPSAEQIAAFVGPQPDPYLRNSDGHDYTDTEVVLQVAGDAELSWQRLSDRLVRTDTHTLEHHGERDGKTVSLGQVTRAGQRWTLNANSRERLAALESLVRVEAPTVREVSRRAERLGGEPPRDGRRVRTLVVDNHVVTAGDDILRATRESWVDSAVNSLGMTPREAARAGGDTLIELEAILDDVQWHSDRSLERGDLPTMDVAWLRDELGLPA